MGLDEEQKCLCSQLLIIPAKLTADRCHVRPSSNRAPSIFLFPLLSGNPLYHNVGS